MCGFSLAGWYRGMCRAKIVVLSGVFLNGAVISRSTCDGEWVKL